MSTNPRIAECRARNRGAALVVGLILLVVLTLLAVSGMTTAALEMQMAGNDQFQKQAFAAADTGIEQAMTAGVFNTNLNIGTYTNPTTVNAAPDRGTGQTITNCPEVDNPSDAQTCEYFMRFDLLSSPTPIPAGGYSMGTGFEAYHFNINSFGTSARGAMAEHTQSFYVIGPSSG